MGLEDSSKNNPPATATREQRRTPRYEFVATVELKDPATSTKLTGRVAEISLHGCYVDSLNPFPEGSPVSLRIFRDRSAFETSGKIIYVIPNLGMGIAFIEPAPAQLTILESWLAELSSP